MRQPPNKLLRTLVPIALLLAGIGIAAAVFINSNGRNAGKQTTTTGTPLPAGQAASTGAAPGPTGATGPTAPTGPTGPATTQPPTTPAAQPGGISLEGLKPQALDHPTAFEPIGSIDPAAPVEAQVIFSSLGSGVQSITLAHHFDTIERKSHTVVQQERGYTPPAATGETPAPQLVTPLAALGIDIDGHVADLLGIGGPIWRQASHSATSSTFETTIVNGAGAPVARIQRIYSLVPNSYELRLEQHVQNLTSQPLTIKWFQFGPVDLYKDAVTYGGDKRRMRFGYLLDPNIQKSDPTVVASDFIWARESKNVLGPKAPSGYYETVKPVWPNATSIKSNLRLVWAGMTNRYFGAALHALMPPGAGPDQKVFHAAASVDRVLLQSFDPTPEGLKYSPVVILRTTSDPVKIDGGAAADLSMSLYAGPLHRPTIAADPLATTAGLRDLAVYNFGGPCAFCTFGFVTSFLLWLLHTLHNYLVFDWALAIMVLVLCVRSILHPVTRWSQIRLQRFGKQMQGMAPKQKKIQEKYKDDPTKMREEMGKLWREEGVNPTGALGCVPMFLQTPVWIALYATLYFAFDLRHQPAFFGVFQKLTGGKWWFLGDLAEPDRFIYFHRDLFTLPLLGPISSLNILPLILGIVFFIQQKYLTPPASATMTPEQQQQQKIMKWMMVVMFPAFMYNAPSGLALYFIVNSTLGILESRWIRAHIKKLDDRAPPPGPRRPTKAGGFMARLQQMAEERQKQMLKGRGLPPPRRDR